MKNNKFNFSLEKYFYKNLHFSKNNLQILFTSSFPYLFSIKYLKTSLLALLATTFKIFNSRIKYIDYMFFNFSEIILVRERINWTESNIP